MRELIVVLSSSPNIDFSFIKVDEISKIKILTDDNNGGIVTFTFVNEILETVKHD